MSGASFQTFDEQSLLNRWMNMRIYNSPEITHQTYSLHFFHWSNEIEKNRIHEKAQLDASRKVARRKYKR